jgi:hypothetical protein
MVTITRKIRYRRGMPALRMQLTSPLSRRRRTSEPADGWFTLQAEPGERAAGEPVTITGTRTAPVNQSREGRGSSAVASRRNESRAPGQATFRVIKPGQRWLLGATTAVIGALAVAAIVNVSAAGTADRSLIVAQRTQLAQLAAQRNQALVTAREAQRGQAAWRAQAFRWRTRALARSAARRKGAKRGGARHRNRRRRR